MVSASPSPSSKLELELRRGALVLAVLSQLREPQYGYSLRLESQDLLASEWKIEDGPPRRYYRLNDTGEVLLAELTASWNALVGTMAGLLQGSTK